MLPDRVSNPGPLTYESGALPTALRAPPDGLKSRRRVIELEAQEIEIPPEIHVL